METKLQNVFAGVFGAFVLFGPMGLIGAPAVAQQASSQQSSDFLTNPAKLLADNPEGGSALSSAVQNLVQADAANLPAIIKLLSNANPAQQAAIGTGLGRAARALVTTNPDRANQIQEALATASQNCRRTSNREPLCGALQVAIASYSAVTGNVVTAANGPGGGGGGGGGLGGSVNGGGNSQGGGGGGGAPGGSTSSGNQGGNSQGGGSVSGGGNSQGQNNNGQGNSVSNH